ncbi:MAG: substrate-binding domain-containing protein [Solirubrobacterales bacterium]|nr:substrate-binding domain-containing protein [Solirubrobacterales bacterium]
MEESSAQGAALTRRRFVGAAARTVAGVTVLGAAGCSGAAGSRVKDKLKIPLANSSIGNTWRLEMENTYRAALATEPFRSQVFGEVYNASNDMSDQAQQLSNLISAQVDAIVIDAASPTGLNGVVGQAIDRGILVVSFDNITTARGALQVNTNQFTFGRDLANWLVREIGGKGNVIMVTGVPGTFVDTQRTAGGMSVFSRYPQIKVVNKYSGLWDSSVAQTNTAAVLPSLPKIDGIWAQGGTDGILKAFQAAGRPLPPTAGESENGFRQFMSGAKTGKKLPGYSIGQPTYLVVLALELARRVLRHEYPRANVTVPFQTATTQTVKDGVNVFPQLQDSFFTPFTDITPARVVDVPLSDVLTGKASQPTMNIKLPPA